MLMNLKALRSIKITTKLLTNLAKSPFRRVSVPCKYCPGICISSCPTFINTGNINLSPLGYSRDKELLRESCLKCWRCVRECPLKYPLPDSYLGEIRLEIDILRESDIMILAAEGLDDEYAHQLANLLKTGLISIKGLTKRYEEGRPLNIRSLEKVLKKIEKMENIYVISPESSHALSIPLLIEKLNKFSIALDYSGPVHIPCLLLDREEEIVDSLQSLGIRPTKIIRDKCIKLETPEGLILCPRASLKGSKTIYDEIIMDFVRKDRDLHENHFY